MFKRFAIAASFVGLLLSAPAAFSDPVNEESLCPEDQPDESEHRYLRSLSLDLRGVIPSSDDYAAMEAAGGVTETLIDAWLAEPSFTERVVRKHRELLWPNVSNVNLWNASANLVLSGEPAYWRRNPSVNYRGESVGCLDQEAEYDGNGMPIAYPQEDGTNREGYEWVAPYWDPGNPIKVCAFDAMAQEVSSNGTVCASREGLSDPGCGCGPSLAWCRRGSASTAAVLESFTEDIEMRLAAIVDENRSYLELLTGREGYVNGPLVHYWTHQVGVFAGVRNDPEPVAAAYLPDLDYTDRDTWVRVPLGDHHSGVLTSPAFLMRFQTNRARANRFFNSFLCQSFQPPSGGLQASTEEEALTLDLQDRAGCKYCHAILEPSAAYWGRWTPAGAGYIDADEFPSMREDCHACAVGGAPCSDECNRFYRTSTLGPEHEPYLGMLDSYTFMAAEHENNVELGPTYLAQSAVVDGRLPDCSARTAAVWMLGRDLSEGEEPWVDELAQAFVASEFNYRELVKAVVMSPVYRRVR